MSFASALNTGTHRGAQAGLVLAFLAFPVSVALANVALLLTLVLWLLSLFGAPARAALRTALRNPLAAPAIALFAWVAIAVAWSPADTPVSLGFLQKYLKFAMVPMFIALLQDAAVRRRCWQTFALAMVFTLAVTWLNVWFDFSWTRTHNQGLGVDHTVFKDYISQGLMMSLLATVCAFLGTDRRWSGPTRWACWCVWVLASVSILLLSAGRTGYLAWAMATAVFALSLALARSRWVTVGTVATLGLLFAAAISSPLLNQRWEKAWAEAATAGAGPVTSIGARVEMARFTLTGARDTPLLGHGTAAYPALAAQHFTAPGYCEVVCPHPHNQFLFFLYEQGAVGLVLFLWFLGSMAWEGARHGPRRRAFTWALAATAVAASAAHSAFWLSTESHCLILIAALTMAGLQSRRQRGAPR